MDTASSPRVCRLVDHLFRHSAGQMVATLTRVFGPAHLTLAEDVVQEALVRALRHWPYHGIPDNPAGWLLRVARNLALDALRRDAALRDREAELRALAERHTPIPTEFDELPDDQLRLMFTCC